MARYLVELYLPRSRSLDKVADETRRAAAAAARDGIEVRYVRSLYLEDDETCFHVFEAPSREAVFEATRRAGLRGARVTEAVESGVEEMT